MPQKNNKSQLISVAVPFLWLPFYYILWTVTSFGTYT